MSVSHNSSISQEDIKAVVKASEVHKEERHESIFDVPRGIIPLVACTMMEILAQLKQQRRYDAASDTTLMHVDGCQ